MSGVSTKCLSVRGERKGKGHRNVRKSFGDSPQSGALESRSVISCKIREAGVTPLRVEEVGESNAGRYLREISVEIGATQKKKQNHPPFRTEHDGRPGSVIERN